MIRPLGGIPKAAFAMFTGLALATAIAAAPAGAAVASTAKTSPGDTAAEDPQDPVSVLPDTISSCDTGVNDAYQYAGRCTGTSASVFRTVAYCANGMLALGEEHHADVAENSTASCQVNNMNSTLDSDWGFLICSNNLGTGTYQGYYLRHGDISRWLYQLGKGSVPNGGTILCQYGTSIQTSISPIPISSSAKR